MQTYTKKTKPKHMLKQSLSTCFKQIKKMILLSFYIAEEDKIKFPVANKKNNRKKFQKIK